MNRKRISKSYLEDIRSLNASFQVERYIQVLGRLPIVNVKCLRAVTIHLNIVAVYEDQNKMSVTNLTTVWAPVLMGAEFGATHGEEGCFDPRVVEVRIGPAVKRWVGGGACPHGRPPPQRDRSGPL